MLAMPNIATVFKAETARIARKDVRAEVAPPPPPRRRLPRIGANSLT